LGVNVDMLSDVHVFFSMCLKYVHAGLKNMLVHTIHLH